MGDGCMDCRRREEEMYWSRFQTVQFFQILSGHFDQQLAIPKKFTNNVREKLGGTENDLLVFKYNGNSRFDVSMFDQSSFCEKEASYFVKKCAHTEIESTRKRKRNMPERIEDTDELFNESSDDVEYRPVNKPRNNAAKTPASSRLPTRANAKPRRGNKKGKRGSRNKICGYPMQLTSCRRAVTQQEKEKAKEKAKAHAASLKNSFIVVMRQSHVYKGFYMSIPAEWSRVHLRQKSQDVVLRLKENAWKARYHHKGGYSCGLTGGWKKFVLDNFLEEFDVCLFHLAGGINDGIIFDVSIFRVVEEVIPPSRVPRAPQGRDMHRIPTKTLEKEGE
ncbi:B3 domain-containing protein REM16 [Abeliophyllum distichum]|uniref:B3 domain-containing protein REM16 n=1 Tax=Abeliophyllum distichum TaxID=126358 RepID=A0ABD1STX8_9LAMI